MPYCCERNQVPEPFCRLVMCDTAYETLRDHPDIFFSQPVKGAWSKVPDRLKKKTVLFLDISACLSVLAFEWNLPNMFETELEAVVRRASSEHRFLCNMEILALSSRALDRFPFSEILFRARMCLIRKRYVYLRKVPTETFMFSKLVG